MNKHDLLKEIEQYGKLSYIHGTVIAKGWYDFDDKKSPESQAREEQLKKIIQHLNVLPTTSDR